MCGIFGALVVERGAKLNIAVLEELAIINEERGHHAFGFASTNGKRVQVYKSAGAPSELCHKIGELLLPRATALVAHTRHATHGSPEDNRNNHPHNVPSMRQERKRDGVIVHNGVVANHLDLVDKYRLKMTTECDSEVIAKLLSSKNLFSGKGSGRISTLKRASLTAEAMDCPSAFMYMAPRRFAAVRMGRPLWWHKFEGVVYFSSIALDFSEDFARGQVTDNAVRTYNWSHTEKRWRLVGKAEVTRGKRGTRGARHAVSELTRDWRRSSVVQSSLEFARNDYLRSTPPGVVQQKVNRLQNSGDRKPNWKRVADEFRRAEKEGDVE